MEPGGALTNRSYCRPFECFNQKSASGFGFVEANQAVLAVFGLLVPQPATGGVIVTGADAGSIPIVRVFDAVDGFFGGDGNADELYSFLAYDAAFRGGVRVAVGYVTGDGTPDIITGAGYGGYPHVRVFDGLTGQQAAGPIGSFFAFTTAFMGGVYVAAGGLVRASACWAVRVLAAHRADLGRWRAMPGSGSLGPL